MIADGGEGDVWMGTSRPIRVVDQDKARRAIRVEWGCVAAMAASLFLQGVLGGWWWCVSVVFGAVALIIRVVRYYLMFRFVGDYERTLKEAERALGELERALEEAQREEAQREAGGNRGIFSPERSCPHPPDPSTDSGFPTRRGRSAIL